MSRKYGSYCKYVFSLWMGGDKFDFESDVHLQTFLRRLRLKLVYTHDGSWDVYSNLTYVGNLTRDLR